MATKRVNIKIGVIIILLLIVLIILLIQLNSKKKDEIFHRVILGLDNLNYSYTDNNNVKFQIYGKYEKITYPDKIEYIDYENKVTKVVYLDSNYFEEYKNNGIVDMDYYIQNINNYFSDVNNYKYKGKKEMNGKKYRVVQIKDSILGKGETYFLIDDETNVIKKVELYQYINHKKEKIIDKEFNFDNGSNKLEDVKFSKELLTEYSSDTNN